MKDFIDASDHSRIKLISVSLAERVDESETVAESVSVDLHSAKRAGVVLTPPVFNAVLAELVSATEHLLRVLIQTNDARIIFEIRFSRLSQAS